jgi:hypothetical protein
MRPFSSMPAQERRDVRGLLFDLDDTLLDGGRLHSAAYGALCRLAESGVELVCVTGRPSSWGQVLARQWPIRGAVTENGAIAFYRIGSTLRVLDRCQPCDRLERQKRLRGIAEQLQQRRPELVPTDDCGGRLTDYTFDLGEHRQLDEATVRAVRAEAHSLGARTITSSIHLHVSLDCDDKASGALRFLERVLAVPPSRALYQWAFIGDSSNDAACFAAFRHSIGVSNLRGSFSVPPRYITRAASSAGFIEVAEALLSVRPSAG